MSISKRARHLLILGILAGGLATGLPQAVAAGTPPKVEDQAPAATGITRTGAVLTGAVNPELSATSYEFEYGASAAYGHTTAQTEVGAGEEEIQVSQKIQNLHPGTTYHYALIATSTAGTTTSTDRTFTTAPPQPPEVSGVEVNSLAPGAATITGTVSTNGLATSYEIDFGGDTTYPTRSVGEVVGLSQSVTLALLYLQPETTYHYRLRATNEDGIAASVDRTFKTPPYALVIPPVLPQIAVPQIKFPAATVINKSKSKAKNKKRHKTKTVGKHKKK